MFEEGIFAPEPYCKTAEGIFMQNCTLIPDSRERVHPHLFTRYSHVGAVRVAVRVALNSPVASVAGVSFTHNTFNESTAS